MPQMQPNSLVHYADEIYRVLSKTKILLYDVPGSDGKIKRYVNSRLFGPVFETVFRGMLSSVNEAARLSIIQQSLPNYGR